MGNREIRQSAELDKMTPLLAHML